MAGEQHQHSPVPTGKYANSLYMIAERRNSRGSSSVPSVFARLKSVALVTSSDEDMFGNVFLHHAFASCTPDFAVIQKSLAESPSGARVKNQFGRIPLHYALDRTKVNMECFHILLKIYPEGANEEDDSGCTPYDLSLRWNHGNNILKALLDADPSQDKEHYMKLKWGPLSSIVSFFVDPSLRKRSGLFTPKAGKVAVDDGNEIDPTYLPFKDGDAANGVLIVDSSKGSNDQKGQSRDGNDGNDRNGEKYFRKNDRNGRDKDDNDSISSEDVQAFGLVEESMKIIDEEKNEEGDRGSDSDDRERDREGPNRRIDQERREMDVDNDRLEQPLHKPVGPGH